MYSQLTASRTPVLWIPLALTSHAKPSRVPEQLLRCCCSLGANKLALVDKQGPGRFYAALVFQEYERPTITLRTARDAATRDGGPFLKRPKALLDTPRPKLSTHPSKADTPRTSSDAMRSARCASLSWSARSPTASVVGAPTAEAEPSAWPSGRAARCHASYASRTSATVRELGLSCLLASMRSGKLSKRGELSTSSVGCLAAIHPGGYAS